MQKKVDAKLGKYPKINDKMLEIIHAEKMLEFIHKLRHRYNNLTIEYWVLVNDAKVHGWRRREIWDALRTLHRRGSISIGMDKEIILKEQETFKK